jgi:hypothetical protein
MQGLRGFTYARDFSARRGERRGDDDGVATLRPGSISVSTPVACPSKAATGGGGRPFEGGAVTGHPR